MARLLLQPARTLLPVVLGLAFALAGCGGGGTKASGTTQEAEPIVEELPPDPAATCVERWNNWLPTIGRYTRDYALVSRALQGATSSSATVIASEGKEPGTTDCGVAIWVGQTYVPPQSVAFLFASPGGSGLAFTLVPDLMRGEPPPAPGRTIVTAGLSIDGTLSY